MHRIVLVQPVAAPPENEGRLRMAGRLAHRQRPQLAGLCQHGATEAEVAAEKLISESFARGRPFGSPDWQKSISQKLGLQSTLRPIGRPKKKLV